MCVVSGLGTQHNQTFVNRTANTSRTSWHKFSILCYCGGKAFDVIFVRIKSMFSLSLCFLHIYTVHTHTQKQLTAISLPAKRAISSSTDYRSFQTSYVNYRVHKARKCNLIHIYLLYFIQSHSMPGSSAIPTFLNQGGLQPSWSPILPAKPCHNHKCDHSLTGFNPQTSVYQKF
jgi:hypothetical protein